MVSEQYVEFETAKLLREKGFDADCEYVYTNDGTEKRVCAEHFMEGESCVNNSDIERVAKYDGWITYTQGDYAYLCPTQAMALRWLREEKHYYIQIMLDSWALGGHSGYYIVIQDINSDFEEVSPAVNDNDDVFFKTYEEAAEAAIKYVLEKLV